MTSKNYIADIDYPSNVKPFQNPLNIHYVAVESGKKSAKFTNNFAYCDLGCGDGSTLIYLAALFPEAKFYGVDFNDQHIQSATKTTNQLGLSNVTFIQGDFAKLDDLALPDFDYICCFGAFSWISAPLQDAILAFVSEKLSEQGCFMVHYCAAPGKVQIDPMWKFVRELSQATDKNKQDSSLDKITRGVNKLVQLKDSGSKFLKQNPLAANRYQKIPQNNLHYLAHEVLTDWQALYHADIARKLETKALFFSGLHLPHLNIDALNYPQEAFAMIEQAESSIQRETIKDFIVNRGVRADIYVKSQNDNIAADEFGNIKIAQVSIAKVDGQVALPTGVGLTLTEDIQNVLSAFKQQPLTLNELSKETAFSDKPQEVLKTIVTYLVAAKLLVPVISEHYAETKEEHFKFVSSAVKELASQKLNVGQPMFLPSKFNGQITHLPYFMAKFLQLTIANKDSSLVEKLMKDKEVIAFAKEQFKLGTKQAVEQKLSEREAHFNEVVLADLVRDGILI